MSPEARSCAPGHRVRRAERCRGGVLGVVYPPGHAPGACPGGTPPPVHHPVTAQPASHGVPARKNGPLGSMASRGARGTGTHGNTREYTGIRGQTPYTREYTEYTGIREYRNTRNTREYGNTGIHGNTGTHGNTGNKVIVGPTALRASLLVKIRPYGPY